MSHLTDDNHYLKSYCTSIRSMNLCAYDNRNVFCLVKITNQIQRILNVILEGRKVILANVRPK